MIKLLSDLIELTKTFEAGQLVVVLYSLPSALNTKGLGRLESQRQDDC